MIEVNIQADGHASILYHGRTQAITTQNAALARESVIDVLVGLAQQRGQDISARVLDIGTTRTLTIHPNGHVDEVHTAANKLGLPEAALEPPAARHTQPTGLRLTFPNGTSRTINTAAVLGRNPDAVDAEDVLIPIPSPGRLVSATHCRIELHPTPRITDLGSGNGTNLRRGDKIGLLPPHAAVNIHDGDMIRIGECTITLTYVTL